MAKVKQPIKEEWDTIKENKNSPIELIKKEKDSGVVRVKRLKPKRRSKGSGLKELGIK